jgi:hypothetical protein
MAAPNCVVGARVNLSTGEYGVPLLHEGLREFVMIECAPATPPIVADVFSRLAGRQGRAAEQSVVTNHCI